MKNVINFKKFCEARLADLVNIKGFGDLSDQFRSIKDAEFDLTKKLPNSIKLENGSILKIRWYDIITHDLVKRLKERTSFSGVDHFIEVFSDKMDYIFPNMIGKKLKEKGRYSIYLKEYNISIIIGFDLDKNMGRNYFINVITVLPGRKGKNIVDFIDID